MPDFIYLRLFLFSGLILHKLAWEIMKRRDGIEKSSPRKYGLDVNSLLKIIKVLFLSFLVIQTLFLDIFPILDDSTGIRVVGVIIYMVGLIVAISGRIQLGNNWVNLEDYQVIPDQKLVQDGLYAYIRHPIYTGDILLILGLQLALNSWIVLIVIPLVIYVARQTGKEEAILNESFSGYAKYQDKTKKFIPYVI